VEARDALDRYGIDPSRPYVLFVGRITRQKGILYLARAIPEIDPSAQVVLCAGAPDTPEIAAEMESVVASVSGRGGVIWVREMLPREAIVQLYSHDGVLLSVDLRAVRDHQPGGDGVRDAGGRERGRRDSGSGDRR
jgi:glycosyltransferase involved in cell wall biosynthesis